MEKIVKREGVKNVNWKGERYEIEERTFFFFFFFFCLSLFETAEIFFWSTKLKISNVKKKSISCRGKI